MSSRTDESPQSRKPLSRERVLAAAIAIADEAGLDALTMRRLGQQLGVEAMSLYKHVANKGDILDGMVDMVIGKIDLPPPEADWRTAMRQRAFSARQVLASHPWAIGMLESRTSMGPASTRYVDAVIGSLRAGGFSVEMAAYAFLVLDSHVYGFVVQESGFSVAAPEGTTEPAETMLETLPTYQYPHLAEMASEHLAHPDHYYDQAFEFGLELILDGLEQHRNG
jgi:AcrR family transcriptional regulator